jgi:hypothetical protein
MEAFAELDEQLTLTHENLVTNKPLVSTDRLTTEIDKYKGLVVISILSGGIISQVAGRQYQSINWLTSESVELSATIIHHLDHEIEMICRRFAMIQERKRIEMMNQPQSLDARDSEEIKTGGKKLLMAIGFHALSKGVSNFVGEDSSIINLIKMVQKLFSGESTDLFGVLKKIQTAFL